MTTARELMTADPTCVRTTDTLAVAAQKMRDLGVGSLPICGDDDRLTGVVTDRDIVVRCIAEGSDPSSTEVSVLADGKPVTIGADDDVEEALRTMASHDVRRLPVIDGHDLVGVLSQADVARALPPETVGRMLAEVSTGPDNN